MHPFHLLLVLFLLVPLVEIYLLIQVGGLIGAMPTVALVVLTAVLGAALLKAQGLATWRRVNESLARGELPAVEMLEGVALLVGGALLLTPGFFTDAVGFLCLIPGVRRAAIRRFLRSRFPSPPASGGRGGGRTLEGEFWRDDEGPRDN